MDKIVGMVAVFSLFAVSCQTLFNKPQVEYSPLLSGTFTPRSQPARIVSGTKPVSPSSYKKIGIVSLCEKVSFPDQLEEEKIAKMVKALRQQASEQGGDLVRQKEDLKKNDILKWRYVKLNDSGITGESGSIDILSVVYKMGEDLTLEVKDAKTGGVETDEEVTPTDALECVKAEVWRKIE